MARKIKEIEVSNLGLKGHGMSKSEGHQFIIRGHFPGDLVEVAYDDEISDWQEVEVLALKKSSADRVPSFCSYHPICQGCPWSELSYDRQCEEKISQVRHAFSRINRNDLAEQVQIIHRSPKLIGFRDRCQIKYDGQHLGFVTSQKTVVDVHECKALNPKLQHLMTELRISLPDVRFTPRENHPWSFVDLDLGIESLDEIKPNKKRAFSQAMSGQNQVMHEWLSRRLKSISPFKNAIELFAGGGNFTKVLLQNGPNVHALEFQVESLKALAKIDPHLKIEALNLYHRKSLNKFWRQNLNYDLLVANPPQEGIHFARQWVENTKVKNVFYISCSLDSFISDAQQFMKAKLQLQNIELVDQFPHTPHIEILSHWSL
ncbi:MAG: hypothetical protein OHK0056_11920 [Bacteriovoracaceae bacterium]